MNINRFIGSICGGNHRAFTRSLILSKYTSSLTIERALAVAAATAVTRSHCTQSSSTHSDFAHIDVSQSPGLLAGMVRVKKGDNYSKTVDRVAVSTMLRNCGYMFDKAVLDCGGDESQVDAYLDGIISRSEVFMDANKVWDRDVLKSSINRVINKKG